MKMKWTNASFLLRKCTRLMKRIGWHNGRKTTQCSSIASARKSWCTLNKKSKHKIYNLLNVKQKVKETLTKIILAIYILQYRFLSRIETIRPMKLMITSKKWSWEIYTKYKNMAFRRTDSSNSRSTTWLYNRKVMHLKKKRIIHMEKIILTKNSKSQNTKETLRWYCKLEGKPRFS